MPSSCLVVDLIGFYEEHYRILTISSLRGILVEVKILIGDNYGLISMVSGCLL
jgi:hypothetical protein